MSPARPEMETGVRVKAWAPAGGTTLSVARAVSAPTPSGSAGSVFCPAGRCQWD